MAAQPISPNPAQPPPDLPTREVYWNIAHGQIWVMYLLFAVMLAAGAGIAAFDHDC